ncbi:cell division protein FtsI [Nocardiopsis sp. HNM0947]|uniref:Cell division protein FtsI n=1 Tax=Nocardiopsis coralli TaxID=2772213 RepID=A0ABR9P7N7_9ACTN|nr:penicillin-binding transpeptidase domain-containing protein [Nocardiopsis coralli]MBE2999865.1 cell division protein FtsI [Nocardiopsis coralli]
MSPRPLGRRAAAAGTGLLVTLTLVACTPHPSAEVAVRSFLLAWQDGDYAEAARYTDGDAAEVESTLADVHDQLDLASLRFDLGPISEDGESATAEFEANADLGIGDPTWTYTGEMPLEWGPDGWEISWSPSVIHPEISEGERLAVSYQLQDRGQILDRDGTSLVTPDSVTAFGVLPSEMDDKEEGVAELAELLDEDPDPLLQRVRSAPPEEFQPLVLLRDSNVDANLLRQASQIAGVDTQAVEVNMTPELAPSLVGEVAGTSEHRVSARVPGPYQAGDTVGLSGLQSIFQNELAGSATTQVVALDASGEVTDVLESWDGELSGQIETTLDSDVQSAAESAMDTLPGNGYLVAVDPSNGEILAAANDSESATDDGALNGSFAPGPVFTLISTVAALESGAVTRETTSECAAEADVGGRTFVNPSQGYLAGEPDLVRNLAYACTVAYAQFADQVGADNIADTAERFGIGADWQLPLPSTSGSVDINDEEADVASAMIGEHGIEVSPLTMALAAAAISDGNWHAPTLIQEEGPAPEETSPFDEEHLEVVREGMRDAVDQRMMPELAVGGPDLHGQWSRVEGQEVSHHWFVGYQDDVAFALVAEVDPSVSLWQPYAVQGAQSFLAELGSPGTEDQGLEPAGDPAEADLSGPE